MHSQRSDRGIATQAVRLRQCSAICWAATNLPHQRFKRVQSVELFRRCPQDGINARRAGGCQRMCCYCPAMITGQQAHPVFSGQRCWNPLEEVTVQLRILTVYYP